MRIPFGLVSKRTLSVAIEGFSRGLPNFQFGDQTRTGVSHADMSKFSLRNRLAPTGSWVPKRREGQLLCITFSACEDRVFMIEQRGLTAQDHRHCARLL
jgi:hypothetical protein